MLKLMVKARAKKKKKKKTIEFKNRLMGRIKRESVRVSVVYIIFIYRTPSETAVFTAYIKK